MDFYFHKNLKNDTMNEKPISIVITSYNDLRVVELVPRLKKLNVHEIIIADGGSVEEKRITLQSLANDVVKFYDLPGNIAETRFQVQNLIHGDITVFIDTDELPTENWIERITEPITSGLSDFTFGPTSPLKAADNRFTRYLDKYDRYLYENILPQDITKGALGNSAWKTEIIQKVNFDPCLGIGGEDYDLTIRAIKAGYKGVYVKDAVLLHDQSNIRTIRKFVKKMFYNYQVGASLAYRKNGMLFKKARTSTKVNYRFKDPLEIVIFMLKVPALIFSLMLDPWNDSRYCKGKFISKN